METKTQTIAGRLARQISFGVGALLDDCYEVVRHGDAHGAAAIERLLMVEAALLDETKPSDRAVEAAHEMARVIESFGLSTAPTSKALEDRARHLRGRISALSTVAILEADDAA